MFRIRADPADEDADGFAKQQAAHAGRADKGE
jgi:hypothetical protein